MENNAKSVGEKAAFAGASPQRPDRMPRPGHFGKPPCTMTPLTENRDFRRVYAKGKSLISPVLITYAVKNRRRTFRVGITTSKKTGNAVKRNRSRRVIREALRQLLPGIPKNLGMDVVFVARAKTPFVKSTDIQRVMRAQLKEAGVLK